MWNHSRRRCFFLLAGLLLPLPAVLGHARTQAANTLALNCALDARQFELQSLHRHAPYSTRLGTLASCRDLTTPPTTHQILTEVISALGRVVLHAPSQALEVGDAQALGRPGSPPAGWHGQVRAGGYHFTIRHASGDAVYTVTEQGARVGDELIADRPTSSVLQRALLTANEPNGWLHAPAPMTLSQCVAYLQSFPTAQAGFYLERPGGFTPNPFTTGPHDDPMTYHLRYALIDMSSGVVLSNVLHDDQVDPDLIPPAPPAPWNGNTTFDSFTLGKSDYPFDAQDQSLTLRSAHKLLFGMQFPAPSGGNTARYGANSGIDPNTDVYTSSVDLTTSYYSRFSRMYNVFRQYQQYETTINPSGTANSKLPFDQLLIISSEFELYQDVQRSQSSSPTPGLEATASTQPGCSVRFDAPVVPPSGGGGGNPYGNPYGPPPEPDPKVLKEQAECASASCVNAAYSTADLNLPPCAVVGYRVTASNVGTATIETTNLTDRWPEHLDFLGGAALKRPAPASMLWQVDQGPILSSPPRSLLVGQTLRVFADVDASGNLTPGDVLMPGEQLELLLRGRIHADLCPPAP